MTTRSKESKLGLNLPGGGRHYRAWVGPPERYDLVAAMQFNLLTFLGLRENHSYLDIGCGSLRGGKLLIPYLLPGRYFGIEPEEWLIEEGIKKECGKDLIAIKKPTLRIDDGFNLTKFDQKFDYILAQSVFSHAAESQIKKCLSEAKKVMKPTSIFVANFVQGEKDYSGRKWSYPNSVSYRLDHIKALTKEQGLACRTIDWPHPNRLTWLLIVKSGNEKNIPDIKEISNLVSLENRLKICHKRLSNITGHPYVRVGLKIYQFFSKIKRRVKILVWGS